ncbi:MAG: hypothetical protein CME62_13485 [Halobacteriovoraceae bacterium]|nr:hypothetical protein [Halobacteriovoraceae bacterium]
MKKFLMMTLFTIFTATASASIENSKLIDTKDAVNEALSVISNNLSGNELNRFIGVTTLIRSGGVEVHAKFNGGNEVKLGCHRHSAGEAMECHEL